MEYCKIVLVGNANSGKTSYFQRLTHGIFDVNYRATIGVDFAHFVPKKGTRNISRVGLWDLAGQDRFRTITPVYVRDARGVLIFCEATSERIEDEVASWKAQVQSHLKEGTPMVLILSKYDLRDEPTDNDTLDDICRKHDIKKWFATSSKNNTNIEEPMQYLLQEIQKEYDKECAVDIDSDRNPKVQLEQPRTSSGGGGCCYTKARQSTPLPSAMPAKLYGTTSSSHNSNSNNKDAYIVDGYQTQQPQPPKPAAAPPPPARHVTSPHNPDTTPVLSPEMTEFLAAVSATQYEPLFVHHALTTLERLACVTDDDLSEIGLPLGDRKFLLAKLKETMEQKRKEVSKDDNNNNHDSNNNSDNTPNRNIFLRDVTVGAKVAEGNFGAVHQGKMHTTRVALKRLKYPSALSELQREANILFTVRHPNIVACYGVFVDESDNTWYMVTEWMDQGDLKTFLEKKRDELTLLDKITIAIDIAHAMKYLEEHDIVHRDLAARNLLVDSRSVVKVSDFGLSREVFQTSGIYHSVQAQFPFKWTAPEAMTQNQFTSKNDLFSFGIVMYEIVTCGKEPYEGKNAEEVIAYVTSGGKPNKPLVPHCTPEWYQLMTDCLSLNPDDRPSFSTIIQRLQQMQAKAAAPVSSSAFSHAYTGVQTTESEASPLLPTAANSNDDADTCCCCCLPFCKKKNNK